MIVRFEKYPLVNNSYRSLFGLDRSFGNLFDSVALPLFKGGSELAPSLDVAERDHETVVLAELPGVSKEDVTISLEKEMLTISGERKPAGLPEGSRWIRAESPRGKFTRSIRLPHPVKPEQISAELTNGILRVVLPKAEEARPREIKIK